MRQGDKRETERETGRETWERTAATAPYTGVRPTMTQSSATGSQATCSGFRFQGLGLEESEREKERARHSESESEIEKARVK